MKQIPLGVSNYDKIVAGDYYYFDKTPFIPVIERQGLFIMLARPRRMGKSLMSSMLASYYDVANKDRMVELFGNLWIGNHPTPNANRYLILQFDFSKVDKDMDNLSQSFAVYVRNQVTKFLKKYREYYSQEDREWILSQTIAKEMINVLISASDLNGLRLYLFIDEYDNFTNTVLAARGVKEHEKITHGQGFYRNFFESFKDSFDRIFMTGVTPVTYDDLTSGFSIADLVALEPQFNQIVGVTETELREMIEYYRGEGMVHRNTDTLVREMKPWYDNFCFSEKCFGHDSPIYNTNMVLKYMNRIIQDDSTPADMVDRSARTDNEKLDYLVMAEDSLHREERIRVIQEICAKGYTTGRVESQFPANKAGEEKNFKSLLYYYGTLTFGGWNPYGVPILKVTNKTMADLYINYMMDIVNSQGLNVSSCREALDKGLAEAAITGNWLPLVEEIGNIYHKYSSLRNAIRGEIDMQGFIRGMLSLNEYFALWPELELGLGFCDILLVPKTVPNCPTRHSFLIELKYMKKEDKNIEEVKEEALVQLQTYLSDVKLSETGLLRGTDCTPIYVIFQGMNIVDKGVMEDYK